MIADVMHRNPRSIGPDALAVEAAEMMDRHRISQVLVSGRRTTLGRSIQHTRPDERQGNLMPKTQHFAVESAARLHLMAFDIVDGVLTTGDLYFTPNGDEIKVFSSLDGHGLKMLSEAGIKIALITGRKSAMLERRAENLGIQAYVYQGVEDKRAAMRDLRVLLDLDADHCGYMGDDVVDLPVLRACGFSATVADGHDFVKPQC